MRHRLWRRLGHLLWRWAPPVAVAVWVVNFYRVATNFVVPAFGPIEMHMATYRATLLQHVLLGIVLLCLSAASAISQAPGWGRRSRKSGKTRKKPHRAERSMGS